MLSHAEAREMETERIEEVIRRLQDKVTILPDPTPEELAARDKEQWLTIARDIGVPSTLAEADLDSGQDTPAMEMTRHYMRGALQAGQCLMLLGPTGVGKSWAACGALRKARKLARWFFYVPALASALLDYDRRADAMRRATKTTFVVFDDLGTEYLKEGGVLIAALDEIFWTREGNRLPTIVTSNMTPEQFKERMSDRIVDRMRGAWGRVMNVPGDSMRRK